MTTLEKLRNVGKVDEEFRKKNPLLADLIDSMIKEDVEERASVEDLKESTAFQDWT